MISPAVADELEAGKPRTIGVFANVNDDFMIDGRCFDDGQEFECENAGIEKEDSLAVATTPPDEGKLKTP